MNAAKEYPKLLLYKERAVKGMKSIVSENERKRSPPEQTQI